jgi:hypothetical protein
MGSALRQAGTRAAVGLVLGAVLMVLSAGCTGSTQDGPTAEVTSATSACSSSTPGAAEPGQPGQPGQLCQFGQPGWWPADVVGWTRVAVEAEPSLVSITVVGRSRLPSPHQSQPIPANQAKWVAAELIATGAVTHAFLGVSTQDAIVEVDGVTREAAVITSVASGTPAADARLRPGEAVTEVDGEIVASAESLVAQVRERPPGTEVTLSVADRDGDTREVTVEFGTRPGS